MMTLDPNESFFQEDDSHSHDDDSKNAKDNQLYKDTMALLKRKMCTAQDLLEQFNNKAKEYDDLNLELHESKLDKEKLFNKYNTASEKLTRLELSNKEIEKSRNDFKNTADKQKLELDEKMKHIEQLEFKIKEMEKDSFHLKDEIKKLQQENKISKSVAKKATKNQGSQTNLFKQQDASVNTDFKKESPKKPQVRDKTTITDEVTNAGKDRSPILCSKCENEVYIPPVGQILKFMSTPPSLVTNPFSPPGSPRSTPSCLKRSESIASNTSEQYFHENLEPNCFEQRMVETTRRTDDEASGPSLMLIHKLTKRINNLEQKMKKKKQRQEKCCHQSCSSSKNIKFVVQLPNEEKYIKLAKQQRRKEARLKRLKKNQIKLKNKKRTKAKGWQVENHTETQNNESNLQHSRPQLERKNRNLIRINEADLFESPAILVPKSSNQVKLNSCTSETMQTPQTESHSTLNINASDTHKSISNSTNKVLVLDNVNKDECNMQSSLSSTVLVHTSYENIVEEVKQSVKCDSNKVLQTNFNECNLSLDVLKEGSREETVDHNSKNFNDIISLTEESNSAIMDTKNVDTSCKSVEMKETVVETTIPKVDSKQEKQENNEETESLHDSIRRVSISTEVLSENDEILPSSVNTSTTDDDASMDAIHHKSEQNGLQEVDNAKKTNTLRNLDELFLSSPEKIEATDSPRSRRSSRSSIKNSVEKQVNPDDKICESVEESDQSSDDKLNFKCSTAAGNKPEKFSSIIDSDSSEENLDSRNERRKMLMAQRNKLLSKIRNLKKTSKNPMVSNIKTEKKNEVSSIKMAKKTEVSDDNTPFYIPTKKQRVAHKPKDPNEVASVASAKDVSQIFKGTCKTQTAECKKISSKPKPFSRTRKAKAAKDLPCTTKKSKLMENVESEENQEKQSTTEGIAKCDSALSGPESLEMAITGKGNEMKMEISCKDNNQEKNDHEKKEKTGEHSKLASSEIIEMKTDSTENCSTIHANKDSSIAGEESIQDNESINDSNKDFSLVDEGPEEIPIRKLRCRNVVAEKPARFRRVSTRLKEIHPPVTKSDTDANVVSTPSDSEKTFTENDTDTNIVSTPSDCQNDTNQKVVSASSGGKKSKKKNKKQPNKQRVMPKIDSSNSSLPDTVILSNLNEFLLESGKEYKPQNGQYLRNNERHIQEQLSLLMESEPLTNEVLSQVTEKLLSFDKLDVVALVLVEYAANEYEDDVKCNTTYTPPAPPMTKFEQKLVTLITNMKERQPEFADTVEKGLEYKLFNLGGNKFPEVQIVERLFRLLVVLNKIKKDREKVRMLFCDALYCYNTRAINMIHVALSSWSEILPKHDSNNDILVKTIVHIIMSTNINKPFSKLLPLKKLLSDFYGYPNAGYRVENFKVELMNNLKENVPGINTAILLLCKSKGAEWTFENIVKGIKEMVVSQAHPSMYDALTLLGNLLRPFKGDQFKKNLEEITDQLCDVLAGGQGIHDLDEGIVSCLLNLGGKFPFTRHKIALHVLNWNCTQDLCPTTKEKFHSFLKTHNPGWWRKFVRQNFPPAEKR